LEAHHILPLVYNGKDELNNLIILCINCHHFAPNNPKEFEEYLRDEMTGFSTTFMKILIGIKKEHPELFDKMD